jgi:hypothetical protein
MILQAILLSLAMQTPVPPADAPSEGWGGFATGATQAGAGLAACVVCSPLLLCGGPGVCVHSVIVAAASGVATPVLGDWLGQNRGALAWPLFSALALGAVTGGTALAVSIVLGAVSPTEADLSVLVAALGANVLIPASIGLVGGGLTALVPVVVYGIASTPKKPGDHGEGFPGFFSPADATAATTAPPPAPTPPTPPVPPPTVPVDPDTPALGY